MTHTGEDGHPQPRRHDNVATRLNWLRAGVLGANDGIISTAGLVVGVAAATTSRNVIATAGIAGLVAGAVSMALGEYVSVSSQRDAEHALVRQERYELTHLPEAEHEELLQMLQDRGLSASTSLQAAQELSAHDELGTHLELELGLDRAQIVNPEAAAASSAISFTLGALLPLIAILVPPAPFRIAVTVAFVLIGLAVTGFISARLGAATPSRAVVRLVVGGALALAVTYGVGTLLGAAV